MLSTATIAESSSVDSGNDNDSDEDDDDNDVSPASSSYLADDMDDVYDTMTHDAVTLWRSVVIRRTWMASLCHAGLVQSR